MPKERGAYQARETGGEPMEPRESLEPHGRCGAKTRSGEPCKNVAGKGTSHLGIGRCKFHGGSTPMKHGMYSTVARQTLGEIIERERRKMGVAWSDVEELVARLWGTVESHVEDEEILEEVAEDWKQTYDAWDFSGPRQYYL